MPRVASKKKMAKNNFSQKIKFSKGSSKLKIVVFVAIFGGLSYFLVNSFAVTPNTANNLKVYATPPSQQYSGAYTWCSVNDTKEPLCVTMEDTNPTGHGFTRQIKYIVQSGAKNCSAQGTSYWTNAVSNAGGFVLDHRIHFISFTLPKSAGTYNASMVCKGHINSYTVSPWSPWSYQVN